MENIDNTAVIEEEESWKTVNFKIPKPMRDAFKKAAKKNGGNMQSVMFSLAEGYIENADHLKFKLIDSRSDNGRE